MKDGLLLYYNLQEYIYKTVGILNDKWIRLLKQEDITVYEAYVEEHYQPLFKPVLIYHLVTDKELSDEKITYLEDNAGILFLNYDYHKPLPTGVGVNNDKYIYTFEAKALKPSEIEYSWLKD